MKKQYCTKIKQWGVPFLLVPVLALTLALPAIAQDTRGVSVTERPRPDYDPLGIRAGAFIVKPELTLGLEYNDNIYATKNDTVSDWITTIAPRVKAESDWSRHALGLDVGAKGGLYSSESDEKYLDAHIRADGRLDVLRGSYLRGRASVERLHEERGAPDVTTDFDEPVVYVRSEADAAYHHGLGKIGLQAGAGVVNYNYSSVDLTPAAGGGSRSLDHRDHDIYGLNARLTYELLPNVSPFITGRYEWRRYDQILLGGLDRDSDGYRLGLGTGFDLGGVTTGEVFAGYMKQDYQVEARQDISGFWYGMSLLSNVTELTSIQVYAQKSIKETTLAGASGIDALDASLRVDHELLRNLLVGAYFNFTEDDYEGVDVKDKYYTAGPRLTYLWNRNLSAGLEYAYREKTSNVALREYTENRLMASLTGKF